MYPTNDLIIIAPLLFFILIAGFFAIGAFGGWKRAAYWGGGNFLFYAIGLIIWKTAGTGIANLLSSTLKNLIDVKGADLTKMVNSIAAPIFFILVMLIGNIVLVICYYTFAKKLLGLKKNKQVVTNKQGQKVVQYSVATKKGKSTSVANKKWFNVVVGGFGMTALMTPVVITTTQLAFYTTTSTSTRASSPFARDFYNSLQGLSNSVSWFSYYNGDQAGKDYDALFSLMSLSNKEITYVNSKGEAVTGNAIDVVTSCVSDGISNVVEKTKDTSVNLDTKAGVAPLVEAIDDFTASWESVFSQIGTDVDVLFNSTGVTSVVKSMISSEYDEKIVMTDEQFEQQYLKEDSLFNQMVTGYQQGYIETKEGPVEINTIDSVITTSEEAYNDVVDAIYSMYNVDNLSKENQQILWDKTASMLGMILTY